MTNKLFVPIFSSVILLAALMGACHTGVESTKKIELSKTDIKTLRPTPEDLILKGIEGIPLSQWTPGKLFLASDNKVVLMFSQQGLPANPNDLDIKGKFLAYNGISKSINPDGSENVHILFKSENLNFDYPTGKSPAQTDEIISTDLPMLIDMEIIDSVAKRLKGQKLWTLTRLWYDRNGNRIDGQKFVPVEIVDVIPGDISFPIRLIANDQNGSPVSFWMSFGRSAALSRPFRSLFSLSDPRQLYPHISDEIWQFIKAGKVTEGMTKEQCRLSLGNPQYADAGRDYARTIDIWQYPDGRFLRFEDGLLVYYR